MSHAWKIAALLFTVAWLGPIPAGAQDKPILLMLFSDLALFLPRSMK